MDNLAQFLIKKKAFSKKNGEVSSNTFRGIIKEMIISEIEKCFNHLLEEELTCSLGYKKNEQNKAKEINNARNGTYKRTLTTSFGDITINIPRDRKNHYKTQIIEPYARTTDDMISLIIDLYNKNLPLSKISEIVDELTHHRYSTSYLSSLSSLVQEDVKKFKEKKLNKHYFALFLDSSYVPLRRTTVDKEAINIIMGITMDGDSEVLGFSITPSESKNSWEELIIDLKNRGLESSKILISDGFIGINDLLKTHLPGCLHQRCFLHLMRNLASKVRKEDLGKITKEFMALTKLETIKEAEEKFLKFIEFWGNKYKSIKKWSDSIDITTIFNFMLFPKGVRHLIYTNNRIEGLNKEIKRNSKVHIQWVNEDAEEKFLVNLFNRYNLRVGKRKVRGYEFIRNN